MDDEMTFELIPCPFCKSVDGPGLHYHASARVECENCEAKGPWDNDEEIAAGAWNNAAPYPRGWCKVGGPLPDGWYWWREGEKTDPVAIQVIDGIEGWGGGNDYVLIDWCKGEWCGPIPPPPAT